jgi:hypothetical protein
LFFRGTRCPLLRALYTLLATALGFCFQANVAVAILGNDVLHDWHILLTQDTVIGFCLVPPTELVITQVSVVVDYQDVAVNAASPILTVVLLAKARRGKDLASSGFWDWVFGGRLDAKKTCQSFERGPWTVAAPRFLGQMFLVDGSATLGFVA